MRIELGRIAACIAIATAAAGYVLIVRPSETVLATRYVALDDIRQELQYRSDRMQRLPQLTREDRDLAAKLRAFRIDASRADIVDHFLVRAAAAATKEHVALVAIAESQLQAPATMLPVHDASGRKPSALAVRLDEIPLSVTLRGRYTDILQIVRQLSATDVAARIEIDSLSSDGERLPDRTFLKAMIHVALLRLPNASENRTEHA